MLRGFKYRIFPTPAQQEALETHFGACRFVYNHSLSQKIEAYTQSGKQLSCFDMINALPDLKKTHSWLCDANSQSLQMSLRNLDRAFTRFFREQKGFPKFKSKREHCQSYQCAQRVLVNFETGTLNIPKIKNIRCKFDRRFEGKIKTTTISKTATGKYFVSILVDDGKELPNKPIPDIKKAVGIDVGLRHFLSTCEGEKVENPRFLKKSSKRLSLLQRRLSKKKNGSQNKAKQRIKVAKLYEHVTNQRKDFIHKVTHSLVVENQATTLCIEDLNVEGMLKNHCLAKSISDVSWGEFFRQLKYKCDRYGKNLLDIGRFEPSSKMCSSCGVINRNLTLNVRNWICVCGTTHDRDTNAAMNIKQMAFNPQNLIRCIGSERPELTPVELSSDDVEAGSQFRQFIVHDVF